MITKAQITRRASDENLPAKTIERDYVLTHIEDLQLPSAMTRC